MTKPWLTTTDTHSTMHAHTRTHTDTRIHKTVRRTEEGGDKVGKRGLNVGSGEEKEGREKGV